MSSRVRLESRRLRRFGRGLSVRRSGLDRTVSKSFADLSQEIATRGETQAAAVRHDRQTDARGRGRTEKARLENLNPGLTGRRL